MPQQINNIAAELVNLILEVHHTVSKEIFDIEVFVS